MKHRIIARRFVCAVLLLIISLNTNAYAVEIDRSIHAPDPVTGGNTKHEVSGSNDMVSDSASTTTTNGSSNPTTINAGSNTIGSGSLAGTSKRLQPTKASPATTASVKPPALLRSPLIKVCDAHAPVINTIMARASTRAQHQVTLFTGIATKVEVYYVNEGKTAANYNGLIFTVTLAETQAKIDLANLKIAGTFNCDVTDPGSDVTTLRDDLKTEQTDLQILRTAVRSLIVAVAQAEGVTPPSSTAIGEQSND
jgi:hypothetical protein